MMIGYAFGELCFLIFKKTFKNIKKIIIFLDVGTVEEKISFGYIFQIRKESFKMNIILFRLHI